MTDLVIVGGGIAGLSAAWEAHTRGRRALVLDERRRAGGVIATAHVDGFVIDEGPDSLLVQKPAAIALARELGLGDRLVPTQPPRTAYVVRGGRLVPLPEASFLGIPTRLAPMAATALFSWRGKARMALEPFVPRRRDEEDESIGAFMRRRFGEEAVTYLAEPLLAGIHAGDVERLSMRTLFPRLLEAEREHGSVLRAFRALRTERAPDGAFRSFPGGLDELVRALVAALPADTVRLGAAVTAIDSGGAIDGGGGATYRVTLSGGETIEARAVIAAAPARVTTRLVAALDAELAEALAALRYASTAIVALGYRREQVGHPLDGTGFVVPRPERRFLMAGTWVSSKWPHRAPEGHVLLRGFVGGITAPAALAAGDEELTARAAEEFAARLRITGPPTLTRVVRWIDATPQHEVHHDRWLARLDACLARHPGLFLAGSSYRGTGIPDVIADGRRVANAALATLG